MATLLLAVACVGGGPAPNPTSSAPAGGGELRVALELQWATLDPLGFQNVSENSIGTAIYGKLLEVDERGELVPALATTWSSMGGSVWNVTLRPGVEFHDGTPFDAKAVREHFLRMADPANGCACLSELQDLESVEAEGPLDLTFRLSGPLASFPTVLAGFPGMVVSPAAVARYGSDYANHPVGAGPFRFERHLPGTEVRVSRFEGYWDPARPAVERVTFLALPDPSTRLTALEAGDVHVAEAPLPPQIAAAEEHADLVVARSDGLGILFLVANLGRPPLDDLRARQALAHAIDQEALNRALFGELTDVLHSPFPPALWAYPGPLPAYPAYDPERAAELVKALGGLSLQLVAPTVGAQMAQALQGMWREVGIEVEIRILEPLTQRELVDMGSFDLSLGRFAGRWDPDPYVYGWLHSEAVNNDSTFSDEPTDALLDAARAALDRSERQELYRQLAERLAQELPHIYLTSFVFFRLHHRGVAGIPANPDGVLRLDAVTLSGP